MATKKASLGQSSNGPGYYRPRVIVKFRDHIRLPYNHKAGSQIEEFGLGSWKKLTEQFKGISIGPLFTSKKPEEIRELVKRGKEMDPTYRPPDFLTYFAVNLSSEVEAEEVVKAFSRWEAVQLSYVEPAPV